MKLDKKKAEEFMGVDRDQLADILKVGFKSIIIEADEWRPLADYVLEQVARALVKKDNPE